MHRIDAAGFAPGNLFTDGNPATATPATVVDAAFLNDVQENLAQMIEAAGIVLSKGDYTQLVKAIVTKGLQGSYFNVAVAAGTADAITAAYPGQITALTNGMALYVRAAAANASTAPTFTPAAGAAAAKTIVKGNNLALAAGDIAGAGHWLKLQYDAPLEKWVLLNPATGIAAPSGDPSALYKVDAYSPCLIKTAAATVSIRAGTRVALDSGAVINFAAQTAVNMPALAAGEDYSIWVKPDGTAVAVADPFSAPASPPVAGARKIGGFHYGLTAPGTTPAGGSFNTATTSPLISMAWTQELVDDIAGINKYSLWDLKFRPACDPRGMALIAGSFWVDVYFCGTSHITTGTSRYNTNVASGTVLPKIPPIFGGNGTTAYTTFTWYEASEVARANGKRLMFYDEFAVMAFGVTENQSIGGSSMTYPNTGRSAGYTSRWGIEQATGHHHTWGNVAHGVAASAWVSGANRGQTYGTPYGALFGGYRVLAASSGSRCSGWFSSAWVSDWSVGLRAACDHLQLV